MHFILWDFLVDSFSIEFMKNSTAHRELLTQCFRLLLLSKENELVALIVLRPCTLSLAFCCCSSVWKLNVKRIIYCATQYLSSSGAFMSSVWNNTFYSVAFWYRFTPLESVNCRLRGCLWIMLGVLSAQSAIILRMCNTCISNNWMHKFKLKCAHVNRCDKE